MTHRIDKPQKGVNTLVASGGTTPPVSMEERLRLTVERSGLSARALCLKAGLSHGYLVHAFTKLKTDPNASFVNTSIHALADAAGVSRAWLLSGVGSPDDVNAPAAFSHLGPFAELPDWPTLLEGAKALRPHVPAWVWERVATVPVFLSRAPTAGTVAGLAELVLAHENTPQPAERAATGTSPAVARKP